MKGRWSETMPTVDRRIKKTREAINQAFLELMAERDFDKITINDISERANINRGTIYLHYTDKFDLLDKCVEEHLSNMVKFCALAKPGSSDVFPFLLAMFQYFEEHALFYSSMLTNKGIPLPCFHDRLLLMIMQEMNERMNMGSRNREMNNEIVMQFMASAFVGVVEWWIKNKMPYTPHYMAQQVCTIFERSQFLSPPMGEAKKPVIPPGSTSGTADKIERVLAFEKARADPLI